MSETAVTEAAGVAAVLREWAEWATNIDFPGSEELAEDLCMTADFIEEQDGWQPISTAPKDGTEILCWFGPKSGVRQVSWGESCTSDFEAWCVDDGKFGPYHLRGYNDPYPTHWCPLPSPPDALRTILAGWEEMKAERGAPVILRGVGKMTGDGWKDTTKIGEVVFAVAPELPSPYAPGQFPRLFNPIWAASKEQYDFRPATADEIFDAVQGAARAAQATIATLREQVGKPKVKPLEWNDHDYDRTWAEAVVGEYYVRHDGDEPNEWSVCRFDTLIAATESRAAAMAAAQADYEARINSALQATEPTPAKEGT